MTWAQKHLVLPRPGNLTVLCRTVFKGCSCADVEAAKALRHSVLAFSREELAFGLLLELSNLQSQVQAPE